MEWVGRCVGDARMDETEDTGGEKDYGKVFCPEGVHKRVYMGEN